jgi:hypothetical protein
MVKPTVLKSMVPKAPSDENATLHSEFEEIPKGKTDSVEDFQSEKYSLVEKTESKEIEPTDFITAKAVKKLDTELNAKNVEQIIAKTGINKNALYVMLLRRIEELSGLIDANGALIIIAKEQGISFGLSDSDIEKMDAEIDAYTEDFQSQLKPSKTTSIYDMLVGGKCKSVKTAELPEFFIIKIQDFLKWTGDTQFGTRNDKNPAIYIKGKMHTIDSDGREIQQSIMWFPPKAVLTALINLKIQANDTFRFTNNGLIPAKGNFGEHWNIYVEKLQV